jgi:hypothetical protein
MITRVRRCRANAKNTYPRSIEPSTRKNAGEEREASMDNLLVETH